LRWHIEEVGERSAAASGQELLFTDLAGVHTLAGNVEGGLRQEFLSRFDYLLDLAGHRIVLGGPAPDGGSRTALELVAGRPALDTDRGRLVLDSGTDTAILFATTPPTSGTQIMTASGGGAASVVRTLKVRVAGRSYSVAAAYVPRSTGLEDGFLPASTFRAVYVSNSERYIVFEPSTPTARPAPANETRPTIILRVVNAAAAEPQPLALPKKEAVRIMDHSIPANGIADQRNSGFAS
jgi:hypothetical protein